MGKGYSPLHLCIHSVESVCAALRLEGEARGSGRVARTVQAVVVSSLPPCCLEAALCTVSCSLWSKLMAVPIYLHLRRAITSLWRIWHTIIQPSTPCEPRTTHLWPNAPKNAFLPHNRQLEQTCSCSRASAGWAACCLAAARLALKPAVPDWRQIMCPRLRVPPFIRPLILSTCTPPPPAASTAASRSQEPCSSLPSRCCYVCA